ncbi:MAG TPA: hypothetical protein VHB97_03625 [Polyangia bacterium]|nr:hypothetical protein [Polyangia bacterium]
MRSILITAACVLALGGSAVAYDQKVHALLSAHAYDGPATVSGNASAVKALRERIWRAGAEARDPELKRRFLLRWPRLETFDAWSMKQLFALNPEKRIAGFDDDVPLPAGESARDVYAAASRLPDDDQRNRDRFRHDGVRGRIYDQWGRPLPDDPATLEMGGLTGLSSQAHAHYGLPHLAFSDEPSVLKTDPRRFAIPPTVHTFGADFADSYTLLAILAARLPSGQRLALTHAGAAAHHIEDVGNQIHTVQVGIYAFFVDAKIESIKEELASVGGLLRARPSFVSIGIDIISNHHLLAEALYAKHLLNTNDPVAARTLAPLAAAAPKPSACAPGFGRAIAEKVIDQSSYEGPQVYAAIRAAAQRRWSRVGQHFGDDDDPDSALKPGVDLGAFFDLEVTGARRALAALGDWWADFDACSALDDDSARALAETLVRERLDALDAAEARARMYTPKPPDANRRNWWIPIGYVVAFLVVVLLVRRVRRRGARSKASSDRAPPRR